MASKRSRTKTTRQPPTAEVETFLAALEHPFKEELLALRRIILSVDPRIAEGIKWNAPSFRTSEYFATFHLRAKDGVQVILHRGAKKRTELEKPTIVDPGSLLEWLGEDRASVKLRDMKEIKTTRPAFVKIVRQWLDFIE